MKKFRWQGARGEWYVVIQGSIFIMIIWSPWACGPAPAWPPPYALTGTGGGSLLLALGTVIALFGVVSLGGNLTPLPHPKAHGKLIVTGAYRWVRHPIYCGIIFAAFGFSLLVRCIPTFCCAVLLFLLFEAKTAREEKWLSEKFPEYEAYRRRVKKLIPFIH